MNRNLISAATFVPNSLQFPGGWVGHLPFAAWLVKETSPQIIVELGTHTGNSYFSFCQAVQKANLPTCCYAVDTWQGDEHAGYYGDEVFQQVNSHNDENYSEFSHLLRMTFNEATVHFGERSIDLLHIDGLHSYEAVKHDFETWLPKLAPGAIVLFHDTNVHGQDFGVWKFWEEIQSQYRLNFEFKHSNGLGVMQLDDSPPERILRWFEVDKTEREELIQYFSFLGGCHSERFQNLEKDRLLHERNLELMEKDRLLHERNLEFMEKDRLLHERNLELMEIQGSFLWRILTFFRIINKRGLK